jgi:hypothetical protein
VPNPGRYFPRGSWVSVRCNKTRAGTFLPIRTSHAPTGEARYVAAAQEIDGTKPGAGNRA